MVSAQLGQRVPSIDLGPAIVIRSETLAPCRHFRIAGPKHWLWRAVDQHGVVLDIPVKSRRDTVAAKRLLRKLRKKQGRAPRVMISDKLARYAAAKRPLPTVF